jgi:sulfotransferase 6B1
MLQIHFSKAVKALLLVSSLVSLIQAADYDKVFITALPKSGIHLLSTCVGLVTQKSLKFVGSPFTILKPRTLKLLPANVFLGSHAVYSAQHFGRLTRNKFKGVFIIRDPRDVLVSRAYWFSKNHPASNLSIDQLLTELINNYAQFDNYPSNVTSLNVKTLNDVYRKLYLPWQQCPLMYTTKFEDLVGAKGGGDAQKQLMEIKNIAQHLSISLDDKKVQEIAENIFDPKSLTFREGQIGSWKNHFKLEHKAAFKEMAGQLLIDLGYEADLNW